MSDIRFNQWLHNSGTGGVSQVDGGHVGIGTTNPEIAVHSGNNKILNVGIVTASSYYGDGSNLSGMVGGGTSLSFNDNIGAYFGNSQDLKIHHDGNHSYIDDQGTGNLRFRSGTLEILNLAGNKTSAIFSSGGGQTLNFNNSTKFVTTNTGAVVTGILTATSFVGSGADSLIHTSADTSRLRIFGGSTSSTTNGAALALHGVNHSSGNYAVLASGNGGFIKFSTGTTERLRITSGGDFGIGTDNPQSRLEVKDNSSNNYGTTIRLSQGYNSAFSEIASNFGGSMTLNASQGGGTPVMHFQVNDSEKMRIDNAGRVMINQTTNLAGTAKL